VGRKGYNEMGQEGVGTPVYQQKEVTRRETFRAKKGGGRKTSGDGRETTRRKTTGGDDLFIPTVCLVSDGSILLWNLLDSTFVQPKLSGSQSKTITHLLTFYVSTFFCLLSLPPPPPPPFPL
jgi:hypothetical protein